jgi:hypothetical protein
MLSGEIYGILLGLSSTIRLVIIGHYVDSVGRVSPDKLKILKIKISCLYS